MLPPSRRQLCNRESRFAHNREALRDCHQDQLLRQSGRRTTRLADRAPVKVLGLRRIFQDMAGDSGPQDAGVEAAGDERCVVASSFLFPQSSEASPHHTASYCLVHSAPGTRTNIDKCWEMSILGGTTCGATS